MSRTNTNGWLVEPSDDDRAERYADAADELEKAIPHLARAVDQLEPLKRENARRERFEDIAQLLDDHWVDLREHERELSSEPVSTPDPDREWKERVAESERLPDEYEPTPMPDLDLDTETMTLAFTKTPERLVEDRHGNRARQWLANIPSTKTTGSKVNYVFVSAGEETAIDVSAGDVFAIGAKRHDNCREQAFYRVGHSELEALGREDEGRQAAAEHLRGREGTGGEQ